MRKAVLTGLMGLCFAGLAGAQAGTLGPDGRWATSRCVVPDPPTIQKDDAESLNTAVVVYNRYVEAVDAYNVCVREDAERDMRVIRQSAETVQREALRQAESARPSRRPVE